MGTIKLAILSLAVVLFTACGSDDSKDEVIEDANLQVELKAKEFFVIMDDIQTKSMLKISFDENLSSWEVKVYAGNYLFEAVNEFNNTITVTNDSLTENTGLEYKLEDTDAEYLNLVASTNDLVSLKMFDTAVEAETYYYNTTLVEMVQSKDFFVVQNNLEKRILYKITIDENVSQWDLTTYSSNFDDESIINTEVGSSIEVSDFNLTVPGVSSFLLNEKKENSFTLAAFVNPLITLEFYETSEDALNYYESFDLRMELKDKTFYSIENNSTDKKLVKLVFNDTLSSYDFETFLDDYNETAISSGSNVLTVTEDKVYFANTSEFRMITNNSDYLEIQSSSNSLITYRLYNSSELAKTYYSE